MKRYGIDVMKLDLREEAAKYAEACWRIGWLPGKQLALADMNDPFVGGPAVLLAKGITQVTAPDDKVIVITALTRLRMRQVGNASLALIGKATGKDLLGIKLALGKKGEGKDIVHQEMVPTFAENVANDPKHLLNNLAPAGAVVEAITVQILNAKMSTAELANLLQEALDGKRPDIATIVSSAVRAAWIGRAVQDDSWKESADFDLVQKIGTNPSVLDAYVGKPVVMGLIENLIEGMYNHYELAK